MANYVTEVVIVVFVAPAVMTVQSRLNLNHTVQVCLILIQEPGMTKHQKAGLFSTVGFRIILGFHSVSAVIKHSAMYVIKLLLKN